MEALRPWTSVLLGRDSRVGSVVPVRLLSTTTGGHSAGTSRVCPTGARATVLLVLLPGPARLLPLHQKLPGRLDEGGSRGDSAATVGEVIAE